MLNGTELIGYGSGGSGGDVGSVPYLSTLIYDSPGLTSVFPDVGVTLEEMGVVAAIVLVIGPGGYGGRTADNGIWGRGGGSGGWSAKAMILNSAYNGNGSSRVNMFQKLPVLDQSRFTSAGVDYNVVLPNPIPLISTPLNIYIGSSATSTTIPTVTTLQDSLSNVITEATSGTAGANGSDGRCELSRQGYDKSRPGCGSGGDYFGRGRYGGYQNCPGWDGQTLTRCDGTTRVLNYLTDDQGPTYGNLYKGAPSFWYDSWVTNGTAAPTTAYGAGGGGRSSNPALPGACGAVVIYTFGYL